MSLRAALRDPALGRRLGWAALSPGLAAIYLVVVLLVAAAAAALSVVGIGLLALAPALGAARLLGDFEARQAHDLLGVRVARRSTERQAGLRASILDPAGHGPGEVPGLRRRLPAAVARLNRTPLRVGPLRVSGDVLLFFATNTAILTPANRAAVRRALTGAVRGDARPLGRLLAGMEAPTNVPEAIARTGANDGLALAVTCVEDGAAITATALRRLSRRSRLAASLVRSTRRYLAACGPYRLQPRNGALEPASSPAPALLLAGTLDPSTPPRLARRVARGFPNAEVVPVSGAGHDVLGSDTGTAVAGRIDAFLRREP